jgi:hypothetical protein
MKGFAAGISGASTQNRMCLHPLLHRSPGEKDNCGEKSSGIFSEVQAGISRRFRKPF